MQFLTHPQCCARFPLCSQHHPQDNPLHPSRCLQGVLPDPHLLLTSHKALATRQKVSHSSQGPASVVWAGLSLPPCDSDQGRCQHSPSAGTGWRWPAQMSAQAGSKSLSIISALGRAGLTRRRRNTQQEAGNEQRGGQEPGLTHRGPDPAFPHQPFRYPAASSGSVPGKAAVCLQLGGRSLGGFAFAIPFCNPGCCLFQPHPTRQSRANRRTVRLGQGNRSLPLLPVLPMPPRGITPQFPWAHWGFTAVILGYQFISIAGAGSRAGRVTCLFPEPTFLAGGCRDREIKQHLKCRWGEWGHWASLCEKKLPLADFIHPRWNLAVSC